MALKRRQAIAVARSAYRVALSGRTLAIMGNTQRLVKGGLADALIGEATRPKTIETAANIGALSTAQLAVRVGGGLLTAIDFARTQFATDTAVRADVMKIVRLDLDAGALERQLVRDVAWRSAARGAVSGIPAIVPVAGTMIELGAVVADSLLLTVAEARMVLGLCHLRGLDVNDIDRRRLDVLLVLSLAAGAGGIDGDVILVGAEELPLDLLRQAELPPGLSVRLCSTIGAEIVRRVAHRRSSGLLLRLMPGGVSVIAAAWSDWAATGSVGTQAIAYLDLIAPVQTRPVLAQPA